MLERDYAGGETEMYRRHKLVATSDRTNQGWMVYEDSSYEGSSTFNKQYLL